MNLFDKINILSNILKPYRIKNAVIILKREGLAGIQYRLYLIRNKKKVIEEGDKRKYDITMIVETDNVTNMVIEDYEQIIFDKVCKPLVSIIIPVCNQFAYTYYCLKYIKKYATEDYEIIIGDDNSSDLTRRMEEIVKGVRVIHHQNNLQFLKNCNSIAKEAKGKYLVFLNNDTQVQAGWLKALIDVMDGNDTVGMVGSKLIYPNELVQEAGGIVWRDATVLQYGNQRNPGAEDLNIIREADYISGASIMIRKSLWDEIGGFDERFAPAYYEDVDLAFQVREKGYKVVYQPESEVVHFEGVSENKDRDKVKKIWRNREKFLKKWKNVLDRKHYQVNEYIRVIEKIKHCKYNHMS